MTETLAIVLLFAGEIGLLCLKARLRKGLTKGSDT